jgi:hypothetical protein
MPELEIFFMAVFSARRNLIGAKDKNRNQECVRMCDWACIKADLFPTVILQVTCPLD